MVGNVLGVVEMRQGLLGAAQGGLRCAVLTGCSLSCGQQDCLARLPGRG